MKKLQSGFLSTFLAVSAIVVLMAIGAGAFWMYQQNVLNGKTVVEKEEKEVEVAMSPTPVSESTQSAQVADVDTEDEDEPIDEDLETIFAQLFAEKFEKPVADATVTISKTEDSYVSGGIKFAGEIGGGWFLGAKEDDDWMVVVDGNGTVMCADIEPYDFPVDMVPECWDESQGKLIVR
jgi:hypothetical protein